jgi:hypothetical protein
MAYKGTALAFFFILACSIDEEMSAKSCLYV